MPKRINTALKAKEGPSKVYQRKCPKQQNLRFQLGFWNDVVCWLLVAVTL